MTGDGGDEDWEPITKREGRTSMRTMFEFRARAWLVWGLLLVALGILAYMIASKLV